MKEQRGTREKRKQKADKWETERQDTFWDNQTANGENHLNRYFQTRERERDVDRKAGFKIRQLPIMHSSHSQRRATPYQTKLQEVLRAFLMPFSTLLHQAPSTSLRRTRSMGGLAEAGRETEGMTWGDGTEESLFSFLWKNHFIFPGGRQQCSLKPNTESTVVHMYSHRQKPTEAARCWRSSWPNPMTHPWYDNRHWREFTS